MIFKIHDKPGKSNQHLAAATLPVVMVVAVLILLVVLFVYALWDMSFLYYSSYHYRRQQEENLSSAIVLYSNDSTFLTEYDESKTFRVLDMDSTSTVSLVTKQWGFYEAVHVSSLGGDFSSTRLLGKKHECDYRAALWLCDRNRALTLSGETEIRGDVFIPLNGINYIEIEGEYYKGEEISYTRQNIAGARLPSIDSTSLVFSQSLEEYRDSSIELSGITKTYYSFNDPASYFNVMDKGSLAEVVLRGNAVLFADELTIAASSSINEAIIVARKVTIEEGFTGSMQIFCSDTVLIKENVTLQYPSGIYLEAAVDYPYVSLSDNSEVNGYMIILGKIRDEELLFPSYRQARESVLRGLLYVDGTTNIQGRISGAAYLKDCFFTSNGNVYAGTLYNTRVYRNNDIAYPLFLSGEYTRKDIKSIY